MQNLPIDIFLDFQQYPLERFIDDSLVAVESNDPDQGSLPFVLIFQFSKGNVMFKLQSVSEFIQALAFFF